MVLPAADIFSLTIIIICLLLAAFFSSSETSVTSLDALKVKHILASRGDKARSLRLWAEHPERVLATILIYNNMVNILATSIATTMALRHFEESAVGIATGIMTFVLVVFCEILPKSFAKANAEPVAIFTMWGVALLCQLSSPVVRLFAGLARWVLTKFSGAQDQGHDVTEEQLEFMVNEGHRAGVIKDMKRNIIEGAFDFDETRVKEIITPRTQMQCLHQSASHGDALALAVKTGHSRLPVYGKNLDQIVGLVLVKDLLAIQQEKDASDTQVPLSEVMREAFFAPQSKTIMRLFVDLKKTKNHLAIVIDEYGGTAGLVTMEDILEEIVGEIQDEHDEEDPSFVRIEEHIYEVDGSTNLEDFLEYFEIEPFEHAADTIAGWVTDQTHEMPKIGQCVELQHLSISISDVAHRRVKTIRVKKGLPRVVDPSDSELPPSVSPA